MPQPPPSPPRVTLAQLLTVPIFSAVALALIAPAVRSGAVTYYGLVPFVLGEAIVVPLAMALTAQVILRRGRHRERVVAAFLLTSATAAAVSLLLLGMVSVWDLGMAITLGRGLPVNLMAFVIALTGGLVALIVVIREQWSRILPGRCPSCGRRALFVDPQADPSGRSTVEARVCDACGLRSRSDGPREFRIIEEDPGANGPRSSAMVVGGSD